MLSVLVTAYQVNSHMKELYIWESGSIQGLRNEGKELERRDFLWQKALGWTYSKWAVEEGVSW